MSEIQLQDAKNDKELWKLMQDQSLEQNISVLDRIRQDASLLRATYGDSKMSQSEQNSAANQDENSLVAPLDLRWLSLQPQLPLLILAYSPVQIQTSLRISGFDVALEIVENLKGKQLARVLDLDVWENQGSELSLSTYKMGEWLRAWLEIDPVFAAERVLEMDEEFLIHFISRVLEIKPLGIQYSKMDYDQLPDEDWILSHDRCFHFRVKDSLKADLEDVVLQVVENMYSLNLQFSSRVFAYTAMLDEAETLDQAMRWRQSRLADVGFVAREEAQDQLKYVGAVKVLASYEKLISGKPGVKKIATEPILYEYELFDEVVSTLSKMEPHVAASQIKLVSTESRLKALVGTSELTDELLHEDEEVLNDVAEDFCTQSKLLVAAGLQSNFSTFGSQQWQYSELLQIEGKEIELSQMCNLVGSHLMAGDFSNSHIILDFCARYVKGCLSVGVEFFAAEKKVEIHTKEFSLMCTKLTLGQFFQLGWQRIQDMRREVLKNLSLCENNQRLSDELFKCGVVIPKFHEVLPLLNGEMVGLLRKKYQQLDVLFPEVSRLWNNLLGFLPQRTSFETNALSLSSKGSFQVRMSPFGSLQHVIDFESLSKSFEGMLLSSFTVNDPKSIWEDEEQQ